VVSLDGRSAQEGMRRRLVLSAGAAWVAINKSSQAIAVSEMDFKSVVNEGGSLPHARNGIRSGF
jgi:hypothetical protein